MCSSLFTEEIQANDSVRWRHVFTRLSVPFRTELATNYPTYLEMLNNGSMAEDEYLDSVRF